MIGPVYRMNLLLCRKLPIRAALLLSGLACVPAYGQIDPRFAPQTAPLTPDVSQVEGDGANAGPYAPPPAPKDEKVIIAELKGLVLIDNVNEVVPGGVIASGIAVENIPMLDDPIVQDRLAVYLGKPLTQSTLRSIGGVISDWYREKKYPFVDVSVPAGQDVTNGMVQVVVTESRSGKIMARGNRWFSSDFLIRQVRLEPGDRINIVNLEDDKNWINQNPFRLVNIVASRGDEPGVTDLTVDTILEKFPLRAYAGYANSGTPQIGHDRWSLGFIWGNAFWLDDQLSYQFTSSDDFWHSREVFPGKQDNPSFLGHSFNYEISPFWRDKIVIYGTYLQASPLLGPFLGITGTDASAGIRYVFQLPSTRKFDERLQVGYEFKTSNNDLEFGGFRVSNTTTEIDQFILEYDATLRDDYGQTSFSNTLAYSPGGITDQNRSNLFQSQTGSRFTNANYVYDHIVLTRVLGLPLESDVAKSLGWFGGTTVILKGVGQISSGNLLPSEQLGAGGVDSVRGYDERVENGSEGYLLSGEVRSPAFSLAKEFLGSTSAWNDQTQLGAFFDYGDVFDNHTDAGNPSSIQLESVGLGLHIVDGPDTNVRFDLDYGWQLRKLPGAADTSQFGHVSITVAY